MVWCFNTVHQLFSVATPVLLNLRHGNAKTRALYIIYRYEREIQMHTHTKQAFSSMFPRTSAHRVSWHALLKHVLRTVQTNGKHLCANCTSRSIRAYLMGLHGNACNRQREGPRLHGLPVRVRVTLTSSGQR